MTTMTQSRFTADTEQEAFAILMKYGAIILEPKHDHTDVRFASNEKGNTVGYFYGSYTSNGKQYFEIRLFDDPNN